MEINGVPTPYFPVLGNFVYVAVPEGEFVMNVSCFPPKLIVGTAASLATLAVCAFYLWFEKKKILTEEKSAQTTA